MNIWEIQTGFIVLLVSSQLYDGVHGREVIENNAEFFTPVLPFIYKIQYENVILFM